MSYLGSKSGAGVYQAIISQFPPHDVYIETHLGTGAVMRHKPRAKLHIGIDIDPGTVQLHPTTGDRGYIDIMHTGDCLAYLEQMEVMPDSRVLIYADPPYLHSTRTSRKRYRFEYSVDDHVCMLERLRSLVAPVDVNDYTSWSPDAQTPPSTAAAVVISGYPSSLYDDMLADWRSVEFQTMTRGGIRTEKLWMNFPRSRVAWHVYAGSDRTDRQRIKRKAERWLINYRKLSHGERLALLAALMRAEEEDQLDGN